MSRLEWDKTSERIYETGVKNAALYVYDSDKKNYKETEDETPVEGKTYYTKNAAGEYAEFEGETFDSSTTYYEVSSVGGYANGVAWNGITALNETPSGAEASDLYADDSKYLTLRSAEELGATVEAYTYPDEFEQCDGSATYGTNGKGIKFAQQARKMFCLAYTTTVGNDTEGNDYGKKLHIIYNCTASPSERSYATINDSPEAITFSWELTTLKQAYYVDENGKSVEHKTSLITIDSAECDADLFASIEDALYGSDNSDPTVLMPQDIIDLIEAVNA